MNRDGIEISSQRVKNISESVSGDDTVNEWPAKLLELDFKNNLNGKFIKLKSMWATGEPEIIYCIDTSCIGSGKYGIDECIIIGDDYVQHIKGFGGIYLHKYIKSSKKEFMDRLDRVMNEEILNYINSK